MCPVSTKFHNSPECLGAAWSTAPPPPPPLLNTPTAVCPSRKRLDCRRVLTTSKGLVTIAPHIPPRLQCQVRLHAETYKTYTKKRTLQRQNGARTLLVGSWFFEPRRCCLTSPCVGIFCDFWEDFLENVCDDVESKRGQQPAKEEFLSASRGVEI